MLFNITATVTKLNVFNNKTQTATVTSQTLLTQQLNRKGLMIGLAMEQNTVKMYLNGKLDAATAPIFKALLKTFTEKGFTSFVFDLSNVKVLDSAGIAALVRANVMMQEFSGQATVINPTKSIFNKLIAINFHHLVTIESFALAA